MDSLQCAEGVFYDPTYERVRKKLKEVTEVFNSVWLGSSWLGTYERGTADGERTEFNFTGKLLCNNWEIFLAEIGLKYPFRVYRFSQICFIRILNMQRINISFNKKRWFKIYIFYMSFYVFRYNQCVFIGNVSNLNVITLSCFSKYYFVLGLCSALGIRYSENLKLLSVGWTLVNGVTFILWLIWKSIDRFKG